MWPTSDRFLQAIGKPQKRKSVLTVTTPDGGEVSVPVTTGTVTVDGGSRIRRRSSLQLVGTSEVFEAITIPGCIYRVDHGLVFGTSTELLPVFTGERTGGIQQFGDGSIDVSLQDRASRLSRSPFLEPFAPGAGTARTSAIAAVVAQADPTATIVDESTDAGVVAVDQIWTDGPLSVISDLMEDGGTEAFYRPDGVFVIRDAATSASSPVWTASAGEGGTIKAVSRARPLDRMYNTVVVRPTGSDQVWEQQVAQITDPLHELHPSKVGVLPYSWSSPTLTSPGAALLAAYRILDRVQGLVEQLSIRMVSNPALEANEPIRVATTPINGEPARVFQHFVDGFTLDLSTGDGGLDTRNQGVTTDA